MTNLWLILGMTAVTVLPRLLPVFLPTDLELSRFLRQWLDCVPYAALGALIFPGILSADPAGQLSGSLAAVAAVLAAFLKAPAYVSAFAAVAAAWLADTLR